MYSSTRRRRISRWRFVSVGTAIVFAGILVGDSRPSGEQLGSHTAAEQPSARGQREGLAPTGRAASHQLELLETSEGGTVEHWGEPIERQRLVQSKTEHHALLQADIGRELLDLPRRSVTPRQRRGIGRQPRRVPPASSPHGRDGTHPDSNVVVPEPVPEVVL